MKLIGVFGGMFDPVHYGHLRSALEVQQHFGLDHVRLVPCAQPPHRDAPAAAAPARFGMVEVAVSDQPGLVADDCEISRGGSSYTVDTISVMQERFAGDAFCLLLGMDAFLGFCRWHRWREILDKAHIIVMHRPGYHPSPEGELKAVYDARYSADLADMRNNMHGGIYTHAVTQLEISSTQIRDSIKQGKNIRYLMPDTVMHFINEKNYYRDTAI
ncbi:MAG: nicotinate-nucleotide adenylyltransferase [Gammaproteobacteria bacterium]|nr:nicotinate-nucleotide adenylyltransferase [Gammaproteobacteria bacterium]